MSRPASRRETAKRIGISESFIARTTEAFSHRPPKKPCTDCERNVAPIAQAPRTDLVRNLGTGREGPSHRPAKGACTDQRSPFVPTAKSPRTNPRQVDRTSVNGVVRPARVHCSQERIVVPVELPVG